MGLTDSGNCTGPSGSVKVIPSDDVLASGLLDWVKPNSNCVMALFVVLFEACSTAIEVACGS